MKKILIPLLGGLMVLSMAAVSLAAVTINGDFRYDMYDDESKADNSYANTDLRVRVSGDLSDTVQTSVNVQFLRGVGMGYNDSSTLKDDELKNKENENVNTKLDEFWVTMKEAWGLVKMGYYEYKFTPSRSELKSGQYHVWPKNDATFEWNIPLAKSLTADLIVQPYAENEQDDGAYGVALNYKADNWGAKVTYAGFMFQDAGCTGNDDNNLLALDVYYNLNKDMTAFVTAVDWSANDRKYANAGDDVETKYEKNGIDGLDPVIGFKWNNIAGTALGSSIEYALNPRFEDQAKEYNEYILKLTYKLKNNIGLEFFESAVGDGLNKTQLRLRYQF